MNVIVNNNQKIIWAVQKNKIKYTESRTDNQQGPTL